MKCWELRRADKTMVAWPQARPSYCDRGRWHQGIEVNIVRSEMDPTPRYYFDLEAGKSETLSYLKAKKIDLTGRTWVEAEYW
jgi:hypothetical protein